MQKEWYEQSVSDCLKELHSSKEGLSQDQVTRAFQKFGPNKIGHHKSPSKVKIFLDQFKSPVVWVLLVAMVLTIALQEFIDFYVITAVVIVNAVFGFWQEYRAEQAIEALRKMVSPKAIVLRSGRKMEINAERLVPGDVIVLETGCRIPSDARIIESINLQTQEAALTGESLPISKVTDPFTKKRSLADRTNMVFAGTTVTRGHGLAVVVETGTRTQIGKIARMIHEAPDEPTPIQQNLRQLSIVITLGVLSLAGLMIMIDVITGKNIYSIIGKAIALAVAAIPEGLVAVVTISFALGVQKMAKKNALVRKLPSIETLGACTFICTDKTGTLTHNEMTVRKVYANGRIVSVSGHGFEAKGQFTEDSKPLEKILTIGAINNNSTITRIRGKFKVIGDPTEAALLVVARKAGIKSDSLRLKMKRVDEIDFTSERKMMTTIHQISKKRVAFTKGAPEVVLKKCTHILYNGRERRLKSTDRQEILRVNGEFTSNALRCLGFSYRELTANISKNKIEEKMIFVGIQGMMDPPRKEVKKAIDACKSAGIRVAMITGDHLNTAKAVAAELGISGKAVTGVQLSHINLAKEVENIAIYARVNPEHKLHIVQALKAKGHIVAMTGDGANDAPALKQSNIGIAMGI
ncbi:HAD-IC family P-type ATPase, partial [archaeon]|nr:HAD-IC family P-type ATPase [archaeon]